jgi:hypothetical protein
MGLAKLGFGQGEIQSGKHNPDTMVVFWRRKSARPVFKPSGKIVVFFFPKNVIRTARLYIVLQNIAEVDHLYHKHSLHL